MSAEPFIEQDPRGKVNLSELLDTHARVICGRIHTGFVARVRSYDATRQTCEAAPIVRQRYLNGDSERIPVISNIPVKFPSGGGYAITFPLIKGDDVFLSFAERSIDEWKAQGNPDIDPQSKRRFDLADATAYPIRSPSNALQSADASAMVLGEDSPSGLKIRINGGKISIGTPAAELLNEVDAIASELIDIITAEQQSITAVGALGAAPLTGASWAGAYAPMTAQIVTSLASLAQIRAKLALIKDPS